MENKLSKQKGQISTTTIIILLVVTLIIIVGIFFVIRATTQNSNNGDSGNGEVVEEELPPPVYTEELANIKFEFRSARDFGGVLLGSLSNRPRFQNDLSSTERFIMVTVSAQNKGLFDTGRGTWGLGNIIDSEGRNFIQARLAGNWLPSPDLCGSILKPEFEPTSCARIYEVSKVSRDLKVEVVVGKEKVLLDLVVTQ